MEPKKADPSLLGDISQVGLYGEFTAPDNPKVKYAVSLTEMDLTVQRVLSPASLAAAAGRNTLTFSLKDCVGARCHREEDDHHHGDSGVCFSAYFYPFTKRRLSAGAFRRRVEQSFRVASVQDPRANLEEAEKWTRAIRERAGLVRPPRDGELALKV